MGLSYYRSWILYEFVCNSVEDGSFNGGDEVRNLEQRETVPRVLKTEA